MADDAGTAFLIAGPTASGKSAVALALAEVVGGEIVNADAIQVYRDLLILSARPSSAEEARVPHHLFGFVDGTERCSAGRWARAAAEAIAAIQARGRPAIIVGGTGLYLRALEEGLSPMPIVPDDVRAAATARYDAIGGEAFRAAVVAEDPRLAWIPAGDRQRLIRAAEVMAATGRPFSELQDGARAPLIKGVAGRVIVEPERAALYAACDRRFDGMLAHGALAEADRLRARDLHPDLPVLKALGAAELIAHLDGRLSLGVARDLAQRNTRRFAKRQLTWFRNQTADWPRAVNPDAALSLLRQA